VLVAIAGSNLALLKNGSASAPQLSPAGVVNTATMAVGPSEPGSLTTIFGSGLSYGSGSLQTTSDVIQVPDGFLPQTLFGLRVYVNGIEAPLLFASPTQANIQIPWEVAGLTQATLAVTRNAASQAITIPLGSYAPGLFTMNQGGTGQAAAIIAGTSAIPAPVATFPGSRPIHHGEFLALFGTGLGPLDRLDVSTGNLTPPPGYYETNGGPLRNTTTTPLVTVGSVPATVQFSGFAPNLVGVYQVNVLIPDGAPVGAAVSEITLHFGDTGGMNQVLRKGSQKGRKADDRQRRNQRQPGRRGGTGRDGYVAEGGLEEGYQPEEGRHQGRETGHAGEGQQAGEAWQERQSEAAADGE
jgi:uncharacterized protein (TIGR03437 family)